MFVERAGPLEAGGGMGWGGWGLQPPDELLKFVDFVCEKGCKSQGCRNEDSNLHIFEEAIKNAIFFDAIKV